MTWALTQLRRYRPAGVSLFVLLVLLVGAERRLAEAHFNLRTADPGFESSDALDGDEIRIRLIVLNDKRPPTLPAATGGVVLGAGRAVDLRPYAEPLGLSSPRAPPARRSSAA